MQDTDLETSDPDPTITFKSSVTIAFCFQCLPSNTYQCGTLQEEKLGNYVDFGVGKSSCVTSLPDSLNPVQMSYCQAREGISTCFFFFFLWEKTSTESAVLRQRHRLLQNGWTRQRLSALFSGRI